MNPDLVKAITELIRVIGFWRVFWTGLLVLIFFTLWRLYQDWKKRKEVNEALKTKEETIQRLANQERQWRIFFFHKLHGYTIEEAEKLVLENDFKDPKEARIALEGSQPGPPTVKKKDTPKHKEKPKGGHHG